MQKHILNILATWRITEILVDENAPFDLAIKLRKYAYENGSYSIIPDYNTGKMKYAKSPFWRTVNDALQCKWCTSVWVGFAIAMCTGVNPLWGFAYSAGSLIFGKLFDAIPMPIETFETGDRIGNDYR